MTLPCLDLVCEIDSGPGVVFVVACALRSLLVLLSRHDIRGPWPVRLRCLRWDIVSKMKWDDRLRRSSREL